MPLVAVNEQYASRTRELQSGDEIALIPPVAGG
jgi:molybdopterin converting factor small subunit